VQELVDRHLTSERLTARLGAFFGVVALLLAAIGLYGLLSYSVGRRVGEIGLRMALGAGQGSILRLIVGEALMVTAVGAVVGLTASLSSTGVLQTMLFNLSPRDPLTFVVGPAILVGVAIAAAALPAWRASRTDPLVALRTE
jgi:ABC-type antimicrobial peptide transport system permease subunit